MVSNMENLNPQVTRYIFKELHSLTSSPLEGVTVLLNDKDMTEVEAIIDGPADTPYAGGRFRVKLTISKDFPTTPPKGYFLTKIFHPNVSRSGEICVNTLKKDWKSDLGIKHVLLVIKCLLIVPNEEAGKLLSGVIAKATEVPVVASAEPMEEGGLEPTDEDLRSDEDDIV